jgi:acetyltransferase-like isoleucine patch superfamily enzyme/dTDP-4-dehydrorhamnose 3,5-epimerase-like enzyme
MKFYLHPHGICESKNIGKDTKIWAFSHILPGAIVGINCNICDHVFIENDVKVGNNVTIKSGVQLWDNIEIHDNVFIGPNATFSNDKFPRSKQHSNKFLKTVVEKGASVGANATILPGITIGQNAMIGAGATVTKNVPANAIVIGNPARIHGYVNSKTLKEISFIKPDDNELTNNKEIINQVKIYKLKIYKDLRGDLLAGEIKTQIPFIPKRFFVIYNVPSRNIRGEHAHKTCKQFLICVKGSVIVLVDNGKERAQIELSSSKYGLYIPPMVWGSQFNYSKDAILFCLASHKYDEKDYIRNYSEYLEHCPLK